VIATHKLLLCKFVYFLYKNYHSFKKLTNQFQQVGVTETAMKFENLTPYLVGSIALIASSTQPAHAALLTSISDIGTGSTSGIFALEEALLTNPSSVTSLAQFGLQGPIQVVTSNSPGTINSAVNDQTDNLLVGTNLTGNATSNLTVTSSQFTLGASANVTLAAPGNNAERSGPAGTSIFNIPVTATTIDSSLFGQTVYLPVTLELKGTTSQPAMGVTPFGQTALAVQPQNNTDVTKLNAFFTSPFVNSDQTFSTAIPFTFDNSGTVSQELIGRLVAAVDISPSQVSSDVIGSANFNLNVFFGTPRTSTGSLPPGAISFSAPISFAPTSVPEPSSALGLGVFGLLGCPWLLKRKQQKNTSFVR
jgi:hypothetical protein